MMNVTIMIMIRLSYDDKSNVWEIKALVELLPKGELKPDEVSNSTTYRLEYFDRSWSEVLLILLIC